MAHLWYDFSLEMHFFQGGGHGSEGVCSVITILYCHTSLMRNVDNYERHLIFYLRHIFEKQIYND